MTIKTILAKLTGKSAQFVLKKLGRGSTLPGKLALDIDPNILQHLAKDYEIVVISGTNGKTLTTALTVGILKEAFGEVLTNPSGANMISGITSTFLTAKKGKSGKKIAVLEIDEASLPKVTKYLTPTLFVFTNIFKDQMDRYGEIYTTYQFLLDGVKNSPNATVLANGDSPLFHPSTILNNSIKYYGFDTEKSEEAQLAHYNTEGVVCPVCQHILKYYLNTYGNLGDYLCEHCGFKRPKLDYRLTDLIKLTHTSSEFSIDGQDYKINIGGLYNIYNALASVAIAEFFQVAPEKIKAGFEKSKAVFGRQETFNIGDKDCTLVLIKNPVGATQALNMIKLAPHDFSLSVLLNADYADGIDTSWIWDADFESIVDMPITQVFAGGQRHAEIARRLRVTGYNKEKITTANSLEELVEKIKQQESKHAYILATYTAMLALRELLTKENVIQKEES